MDIHGVEIDKVTIGVLCDDDLCSVQTIGQPSNVNNVIDGDSNAPLNDGTLDKGHVISLVIGVSSTVISVLIAVPTLIITIWRIYKCVKPKKANGMLKEPLMNT